MSRERNHADEDEESVDAFAARDAEDDPREDAGYRAAIKAPAKPAPVVEDDGTKKCASGHCKGYKPGTILHPPPINRPGEREPRWCGACVGNWNRNRVEETRDTIRALKGAAATGNSDEERRCMNQLESLVGPHQAGETISAIRASLDAKPTKGGHRR